MILPYMILSPCIFKMRIAGEGSATGAHLSKTVAFDDGRRKRPIKNLQSGRLEVFCTRVNPLPLPDYDYDYDYEVRCKNLRWAPATDQTGLEKMPDRIATSVAA